MMTLALPISLKLHLLMTLELSFTIVTYNMLDKYTVGLQSFKGFMTMVPERFHRRVSPEIKLKVHFLFSHFISVAFFNNFAAQGPFCVRNLRKFLTKWSFCPWQATLA
jgi:hypothetical protein